MNGNRIKRSVATGAILLLVGTVLAACGSDEKSHESSTLKVTTLGLCNEIPVFWAQEKGIFDDNGISVELVKSSGGAAALTALQSGDVDLAFANPFSTMLASSEGIDLQWIATAYETAEVEEDGANAITVKDDSGIENAKALEGKTIGVNEIGGINEIVTTEWLNDNGADPDTVKFVALPFNELASSVANGKIEAAQIPAQEVDPDLGLIRLTDPYVEVGDGNRLVFAGYVATEDKSRSNEKALTAYQESLVQANDDFQTDANEDERFALMEEKCKQPADYLKSLNENIYEARVDTDAMARMGDILKRQGLVDDPMSPEELVPSYIATK